MTRRYNLGQLGTNVNVPGDCWDKPGFKEKHTQCWNNAETSVSTVMAMFDKADSDDSLNIFEKKALRNKAWDAWNAIGCDRGDSVDDCKDKVVDRCVKKLISEYNGCPKTYGVTDQGREKATGSGGGSGGGGGGGSGGGGGGGGTTPDGYDKTGAGEDGGSSPWLWVGIGAAVFGAAMLYSATKK